MYAALVDIGRTDKSGVILDVPSGRIIRTGSTLTGLRLLLLNECWNTTYVNGSSQYSLNIATISFVTIASLVSSVAVKSMKTFRVLRVILECSELMIGGMESTVRLESYIIG
jgi:hypothetical protein